MVLLEDWLVRMSYFHQCGVVLETRRHASKDSSNPERLDLEDIHAYRARELGAPLVISCDAHSVAALDSMRYGVATARRAGCEAEHIMNTRSLPEFLAWLHWDRGT